MALKLVWLTLALALLPAVALAAPGDLDGSFGGDGVVALDWGGVDDFANGVVVQPDGRIVVPGSGGTGENFIVARVGPDGSPDPGFSGNGFADFPLGAGLDEADDVARQVDGKIVAAGFTADAADVSKGAVMRLNPDGSPDGSFGTGGLATIDAGGTTNAVTDLLIQPDGKIVAAGYGGPGFDGVVTRLNPDGLPDSSFDGDGTATFDFGGNNYVDAIARQSDGKLVVLGWTTAGAGMWLVRLNVDGSLDTSFDGDGRKPLPLATGDLGFDVLVQPDGKLVLIGGGEGFGFLVSRLTPDGSFDESFADREGITAINFGASDSDFPSGGAVLQANGKIVVAGYTQTGTSRQIVVARLQPGGALDTTFSSDGQQTLPGTSSRAYGVGLQADGRIVVAGEIGPDALIARLQGDGLQGGGAPPGGGPGGGGGGGLTQVPRCAGKRATIVGSPRSDRLKGTRRADVIVALEGNDRIAAGRGNDVICAGNGNDRIDGGLGNDRLYGQNGNDKLGGASGRDALSGGGGKDTLSGGGGRDSCAGGSGKDRGACERGKL
jgi:uncharacterized delta-60 repeat protein